MLWLRSNHSFDTLLELDPSTEDTRVVRASELSDTAPKKINGFFDYLGATLVGLYAHNGRLMIRIANDVISLDSKISVTVSGEATCRVLTVSRDTGAPLSVTYSLRSQSTCGANPTPFVEQEYFDFGLFVANVVSDTNRRRVALETWSSGSFKE
jgi:hypothetical protein